MKVITLTIDETEAQNLVQLIEGAIRSIGSQAARVGVPLQDKIAFAAANGVEAPKPTTENAGEPKQP
jgi:hypothetical protein